MTWQEGDWRNLYFAPDKLAEILDHVDRLQQDVLRCMTLPDLSLKSFWRIRPCRRSFPACAARHVDQNWGVRRPPPDGGGPRSAQAYRWVRTYDIP